MYTNFETFAKLILFINLTMSVVSCTIKPYEESTDMQRRNLKGNVCLVIEQTVRIEDDKEIEEPISILKFNRYGNLLSDSRERTKYTYDGNGNLLVKRKEDYTYFMGEGLKAMYTYWKYEYDKNYFVTKIKEYEEYDSDNKILSSCQIFARDKYHYVTKSITISNRFDYNVRKMYTDSVEVQYQYNTKGDIIRTKESNGKRILETSYKINQRGLIEMKHSKDLLVYVDSVPYYKISGPLSDYSSDPMSGDPSGYSYEYMNTNQLYLYEYDERDNVIHIHFCDSTNNTQNDIYKKYTYDECGNWIRCDTYGNLGDLIASQKRQIEYYPIDSMSKKVDYSWENEISPLEESFWKTQERKRKEEMYLNDEFVLKQFYAKMEEYIDYNIIGEPKIIYRQGCTFNINFNAIHDLHGGYTSTENITVQIVMDLDSDSFSFEVIKGSLY